MEEIQIPGLACPECGLAPESISAANLTDRQHVETGDLTICGRCAAVLVFVTPEQVQLANAEELAQAPPELNRYVELIKSLRGFQESPTRH